MTGHTKEPWVEQDGILRIDKRPLSGSWKNPIKLASAWREDAWRDDGATEESLANARRIVDCVNALATIPDPAAFVQASRGMAEALLPFARAQHIMGTVEGDGRVKCTLTYQPDADETFTLASLDNAREAIRAFRAATGEA